MSSKHGGTGRFSHLQLSDFIGVRPFRRHSLVLFCAGIFYITTGMVYLFTEPTDARQIALRVAFNWFPIEFWGTLFVAIGLIVIISSRWPPITETWGYMLLTGHSAGWSATYAMGVIFEDSPLNNLTGALNWAMFAFLWWAVSGFVNPEKTVVVVIKDDGHSPNC